MASVNKVTLIGNVGKDPELRYTPSGSAVCTLSLATNRTWKDKSSGEKQQETEWHRIALYDRLAEIAAEYLRAGSVAYIEGRLKTRKWQNKEGHDVYTTEIIADQLQLFSQREGGTERASAPRPAPAAAPRPAAKTAPKSSTDFDDMDDDIPF